MTTEEQYTDIVSRIKTALKEQAELLEYSHKEWAGWSGPERDEAIDLLSQAARASRANIEAIEGMLRAHA